MSVPDGAFTSKSRRITASSCARLFITDRSSSGTKLEGNTIRSWPFTTNGCMCHILFGGSSVLMGPGVWVWSGPHWAGTFLVCLGRSQLHVQAAVDAPDLAGDCLLYTSDAADEEDSVDLGGRRIIKKKKKKKIKKQKK